MDCKEQNPTVLSRICIYISRLYINSRCKHIVRFTEITMPSRQLDPPSIWHLRSSATYRQHEALRGSCSRHTGCEDAMLAGFPYGFLQGICQQSNPSMINCAELGRIANMQHDGCVKLDSLACLERLISHAGSAHMLITVLLFHVHIPIQPL